MKSKPFTDPVSFALLFVLFAFYDWTATQGYFLPADRSPKGLLPPEQYSNRMADALLAGQFHLLIDPDPKLLQLENPYDPAQTRPLGPEARLEDASLYKGRYYLYFGLTPVLCFFLPIRVLGFYAPEAMALVVFGFLGLIASTKLLGFLLNRCGLDPPRWMQWLMLLGLGLCNFNPFLLRDPEIYQVAIACGSCFQFAALYGVFSGTWGEGPSRGRLALGSLCQGLAVGARFNLLLAAPLLLLAYGYFIWKGQRPLQRDGLKTFAPLFLPFGLCLVLIGLYNYVRFDSWTEFGLHYQLSDIYLQKLDYLSLRLILPGLYRCTLFPYAIDATFPYIHLGRTPLLDLPAGSVTGGSETISGMLPCVPLLAILFTFPFVLRNWRRNSFLCLSVTYLAGTGFALMFFVSFLIPAVSMRYVSDFSTFFLLSALLLWSHFDEQVRPHTWGRRAFRAVAVAALVYGILVNLAIGITGYYGAFALLNPEQYEKIEGACEAIRRLFGRT